MSNKDPIPGYPRANKDPRTAPDSDPPRVEPVNVRSSRADVEEFTHNVHAKYGKASFSGPAWVFLVVACLGIGAAGSYYVIRNSDSSRPPQDAVLTAVKALEAKVDKRNNDQDLRDALILQRVGTLESQNGVTQAQLTAILAQLRSH
jgi:hypothetical protein